MAISTQVGIKKSVRTQTLQNNARRTSQNILEILAKERYPFLNKRDFVDAQIITYL